MQNSVRFLFLPCTPYKGTMNICNITLAKKSSKHTGQCCLYSKLTQQRGFCIPCSGCIGYHENRKSLTDTSLKILTLKIYLKISANTCIYFSNFKFIYQNTFLYKFFSSNMLNYFRKNDYFSIVHQLPSDIHYRRISCTMAAKVILFLPFGIIWGF